MARRNQPDYWEHGPVAPHDQPAQETPNTAHILADALERKAWETLRAQAAIDGVRAWISFEAGRRLYILAVTAHGGRTAEFDDLAAAKEWLDRVSKASYGQRKE